MRLVQVGPFFGYLFWASKKGKKKAMGMKYVEQLMVAIQIVLFSPCYQPPPLEK